MSAKKEKPTKSSRGTSIGKADSARERAAGGLNPVAGLDMSLEEAESLEKQLKQHQKDNKKKNKESKYGELTGNQGATATVEALSALIESGNPCTRTASSGCRIGRSVRKSPKAVCRSS